MQNQWLTQPMVLHPVAELSLEKLCFVLLPIAFPILQLFYGDGREFLEAPCVFPEWAPISQKKHNKSICCHKKCVFVTDVTAVKIYDQAISIFSNLWFHFWVPTSKITRPEI